jgi:hypothetical protein
MKIHGTQTVLALAVAMVPAASQPAPPITLKVWNVARLDDQVLQKTKKEATVILGRAGISLLWVDCVVGIADWTSKDPCLHDDGPADFQINIANDKPPMTTAGMLGFTDVSGSAGVYYPTAVRRARYYFVDASKILAAAIVHEVGHMLLGPGAHAPAGVMCASWGPQHFELIRASKLDFAGDQAKLLQSEVKRRLAEGKGRLQRGSDHP